MVNPKHIHLIGEKHVMRYLKGTLDYGLRYESNGEIMVHGFTYLDWEQCAKYIKRTSGCCFSPGSGMISWFSRKKTNIYLCTIEYEYIAACSTCSKAVWIHKILTGLFDVEINVIDNHCDNQSYIKMIEN